MSILICGSLAFDFIMKFNDVFSKSLIADQLNKINVSFLTTTMRKEFGGCAGNIAYNLKLLNMESKIMGTLGKDGISYLNHLKNLNISTQYIQIINNVFTAQCFITTDIENNQINFFHPGAMILSHKNKVHDIKNKIEYVMISPDGYDGMLQHAQQSAALNIPIIFDPGYGLPMFNSNDLKSLIKLANYIIVNDYEAKLLTIQTNLSLYKIAKCVSALIITRGKLGVQIFTNTKDINIPSVIPKAIVDPTGCGDAFRAGLLFGLIKNMDWATIGRLSNLMGSIKIASQGSQNHMPTLDDIMDQFHKAFGYYISLS